MPRWRWRMRHSALIASKKSSVYADWKLDSQGNKLWYCPRCMFEGTFDEADAHFCLLRRIIKEEYQSAPRSSMWRRFLLLVRRLFVRLRYALNLSDPKSEANDV